MTGEIEYGKRIIRYTLEYKRKKNLSITVTPDSKVLVLAPLSSSSKKINEILKKRRKWIAKHLDYFKENPRLYTKKQYISGESFLYLGRYYRLKLINSKDNYVKMKHGYIYINSVNKNNRKLQKLLLDQWFRLHTDNILKKRFNICYEKIKKINIPYPKLAVRKMKRRWGSCNVNNKITLNAELVKAPVECIDYVVIHELCHLKVNNHSKVYYKLLSKVLPGWEMLKKRIEKYS